MGTTCSFLFTTPSSEVSGVAIVALVVVSAIVLEVLTACVCVAAISLCVHLKLRKKNTASGTKEQSKCYC